MTERVADRRSTKEQQRLGMIMAVEDDASNPKRIEIVSTTDSHVMPPYVYWKTVRLRRIDTVNEEGMRSEKVDAVMVWRRKCVIFFKKCLCSRFFCSSYCRFHGEDWKRRCFRFGSGEVGSHQLPPLFTINIYLVE